MEPMVKCRVCANKMPVTGMVLDESTGGLLCRKCQSKGLKPTVKKEEPKKVLTPKGTRTFQCQNCNYRFKRVVSSRQMLKCPYCASDRVIETTENAQRLINEVKDIENNRFFRE